MIPLSPHKDIKRFESHSGATDKHGCVVLMQDDVPEELVISILPTLDQTHSKHLQFGLQEPSAFVKHPISNPIDTSAVCNKLPVYIYVYL